MKISKKNIIKYFIVGFCFFLLAFFLKKPYEEDTVEMVMQYMSDCTLIPGVLLILFNALAWVSSQGAFDGIGYAGRFVISKFVPNPTAYKGKDGFYEYKQSKEEKRKDGINHDAAVVGIFYFAAAMVFYILYYVL